MPRRAAALLGRTAPVLATVLLLVAGLLPASARAQSAPTMRQKVYDGLSKAETLAGEGKWEEAFESLADVENIRGLTGYEKAQLYTAYGFIYFSREDYAKSLESYRKVLQQENLPEAMRTGTLLTIAQLEFQNGNYEKTIEHLRAWLNEATNPGPTPYILMGQAYYQLERYEDAIAPVEQAISIAREQGKEIEENWWLLLRVFHYELKHYDKVVEILGILLAEHPSKNYWIQLAATYGEMGRETERLAAYEAAYLQGFLTSETEIVLYAQLLLQAETPYEAGKVLQQGLDEGRVSGTAENWRLLSQAWTLAKEDRKAIVALTHAAELSDDGELDARLAQTYLNLDEWNKAADSARTALRKGVDDSEEVQVLLGMALFEMDDFEKAKSAFRRAQDSPKSERIATQWISYIDAEQQRLADLRGSME
jgi:tetratricopeptide (TPR) repeat protein